MNTKKKIDLGSMTDIRKPQRDEVALGVAKPRKKTPEPFVQLGTRISLSASEALHAYVEREGVTVRQAIETAISKL